MGNDFIGYQLNREREENWEPWLGEPENINNEKEEE
jgi:hypothetical protein